jgi:hypothetical protein
MRAPVGVTAATEVGEAVSTCPLVAGLVSIMIGPPGEFVEFSKV